MGLISLFRSNTRIVNSIGWALIGASLVSCFSFQPQVDYEPRHLLAPINSKLLAYRDRKLFFADSDRSVVYVKDRDGNSIGEFTITAFRPTFAIGTTESVAIFGEPKAADLIRWHEDLAAVRAEPVG